jgi:hypothetical protein
MRLITLSLLFTLSLIGCGDSGTPGSGAGGSGAGGAAGAGGTSTNTLTHAFEPVFLDAADEVSGLCQSWVLGNEEPLYVKKVRQTNNGGWHHSNWFFVPEAIYEPDPEVEGPDATLEGSWRCNDRGFREYSAAIAGGVFFAQSTQAFEEVQVFPDGAALEIPPRSVIVGSVHLLNVMAGPLESALTMEVETVPADDVEIRLSPISFSNTSLSIVPQAESRFSMTCDLRDAFASNLKGDPDYKIYYVLAHYHEWGNYFNLSFAHEDGRRETVLELKNRVGEPIGRTIDPPMHNDGAMGLQVDCGYINNTDRTLVYGLGGQEMCVFLAYIDANLKIGIDSGENQPLGPNEDGMFMNETECGEVIAVGAFPE